MITETLPVNCYKGNSNATVFDFDFYIENKNQLKVTLINENNTREILNLDIDYSISEIKNKNGSNILYPLESSKHDILNENETILLELNLPICQEVQYNNSSLLNLETLEYSLDYLTRLVQILNRKIALCLKVEENINATPESLLSEIQTNLNSCYDFSQLSKSYSEEIKETLSEINSLKTTLENYIETLTPENYLLKNLSNISSDIKSELGSYSLPSTQYLDLELGASGSAYTAPANGWYSLAFYHPSNTSYIRYDADIKDSEGNIIYTLSETTNLNDQTTEIIIPIQKGMVLHLTYGAFSITRFRFIYAEGEI